jgi:hypothetical protein
VREGSPGEQLRFQSAACGEVGSPLYEKLLRRAADDYEHGGPTRAVLAGHEEDPEDSALALRLMGAVHRLVLEGEAPELARRYRVPDGDRDGTWEAFRTTLAEQVERLRALVERPVQTNEVGRCAALLPGLLGFAARTGLPLRLLEVGASAGLNLRWAGYRYEAEGFAWGPEDSPLLIAFELSGGEIPATPATVAERAGCDASPVDACSEDGRLTLLSYVWPDQPARLERLRTALALAAADPVEVERAGAVEWARERLAEPATGRATIVYHSIVMQYLSADGREDLRRTLADAGSRADTEAPLAWLRMEPDGPRAAIRMTTWPGGEDRLLARAGYHGNPVEIQGP